MRTYSLKCKVIAALTAVGLVGLGCAGGAEDAAVEADPGSREVTMEVWINVEDESGARTMTSMGSNAASLDEIQPGSRALVIDGTETSDLGRVRSGNEIVIPLNTGETATLQREEDRLTLVSFTGEDDGTSDLPRGAVEAVRMLDDGIEVYLSGSTGDEPDSIVRVSGLEDLDAERSVLITALALDHVLVSLEDAEQLIPAIAIGSILGRMGAVWAATCGSLLAYCAWHCVDWPGFAVECGAAKVTWEPLSVDFTFGFGCTCR